MNYRRLQLNKEAYNHAFDDLVRLQLGLCAVCCMPNKRLVIDHDHRSGQVRGLVCNRCNVQLHGFDRPMLAVKLRDYIHAHELDIRAIPTETREYLPTTGSSIPPNPS